MGLLTRTAMTAALIAALAAGSALPADATPRHATVSAAAKVTTARFTLPAPKVDPSVPTPKAFTVHATQRTVCKGTAKCVAFSGTAVPGQQVVVRYDQIPGTPRSDGFRSGPATALIATADAKGHWSGTATFTSPQPTGKAPHRSVKYRVIMSEDIISLTKTGQYLGAIPVR